MTDLEEIKTALAAATTRPWCEDDTGDEIEIVGRADNAIRYGVCGEWTIAKIDADELERETVPVEANAHLIANAPAWLDEMITELEQARAEIYRFKLAVLGSEDVPGHAHSLTVEEAEEMLREERQQHLSVSGTLEATQYRLRELEATARKMVDAIERGTIDSEEIVPVPGDGQPHRFHETWGHHARAALDRSE